jgi:hypothetical protein
MSKTRWDETWHRLREWTNGQGPSERLAAQILLHDGFSAVDPSHPLGGKDGGKDAVCLKEGARWAMGVYFPRGQKSFSVIKKKFTQDLKGARLNDIKGFAFVTNQELTLAQRSKLADPAHNLEIELYHLERLTSVLDSPPLAATRKQFLGVDFVQPENSEQLASLRDEMQVIQRRIEGLQTGGDSFCYFMLYHFDLSLSIAQNLVVVRVGEFPLYDVRIRIMDIDLRKDIFERAWGEVNAPADFLMVKWSLQPSVYYRVFFHARNGSWHQDLVLKRSEQAECWLAATRVIGRNGRDVLFLHFDNEFEHEFGVPEWRS